MSLWQDIRYGSRMLGKSPGFAVTAVLTIALGIGATTAIFSVCDALLWKPMPLPHLETLVMVLQRVPENPDAWNDVSPADVDDIRRGNTSLQAMASWSGGLANIVSSGGEPERVFQALTTSNFFDVLGVQPALGRTFLPGEDQPGREREVVLSDRLWRRRFGADPSIVGKTLRLDDENYEVRGVMPASFDFPLATEVWTPVPLSQTQLNSRTALQLASVGRLKPGRTVQQVQAELTSIASRLEKEYPNTNKNRQFMVWPAIRFLVEGQTAQYLKMLLGSVIFVLLIACANVANLQFARATSRLREVAVRTALGASRSRVIVQLLTESVLISITGALAGLLLARWGISAIANYMPPEIQRFVMGWDRIQLDGRALAFTLLAAVASGIVAGLAPAWQMSRPNLTDALKEGGRGSSSGKGRHRLRNFLVAAEMALAVVLLVGAGLMVRGFQTLVQNGASFEPQTLLTLRLAITETKYHEKYQVAAFYRQVVERIRPLPGVRSVAAVSALPYTNHAAGREFTIQGRPIEPGNQPNGMYQVASTEYFSTLHVPLRAGRFLQPGDGPDAPRVAVISENMAQHWWPNESPIGKHIKIGRPDSKDPWLTIVGVVGNVWHNPYDRGPRRTIYVPFQQAPATWMDIGVRAAGDPLRLAPGVTAAIRSVDPEQPITDMFTLARAIHNSAIGLNYMAALMGIFGVVALVLSAIGVYGVMAFMVSEQKHDIGIRVALGAPRMSVLATVFRRGMYTAGAGMAIGLLIALGFARLLSSLVYGVSATDAMSFVGIPLTLAASAALATYVPARKAMQIDPIIALRHE
jgi:putative ABC transport system permease protein